VHDDTLAFKQARILMAAFNAPINVPRGTYLVSGGWWMVFKDEVYLDRHMLPG
jgi:hypothetical protein